MPLCRSDLLRRGCCSGITAALILRKIALVLNTIRIFCFQIDILYCNSASFLGNPGFLSAFQSSQNFGNTCKFQIKPYNMRYSDMRKELPF